MSHAMEESRAQVSAETRASGGSRMLVCDRQQEASWRSHTLERLRRFDDRFELER